MKLVPQNDLGRDHNIEPAVLLSVANSVILKRILILFSAKGRSVSSSATMTLQCLSGRSVLKGLNQKSRADTRAGSRKEHIYETTRFSFVGICEKPSLFDIYPWLEPTIKNHRCCSSIHFTQSVGDVVGKTGQMFGLTTGAHTTACSILKIVLWKFKNDYNKILVQDKLSYYTRWTW